MPIAVVLTGVLAARVRRHPFPDVQRDMLQAVGAVAVGAAAKTLLITRVNPWFRRPGVDPGRIRRLTGLWMVGNGITIMSLGVALVRMLRWRADVAMR